MPVTGLRGRQILDGDIVRADLNTTTSGSAVTRRIVAGTNITISSTGVDTGTGDVTINASTPTITLQNLPEAWIKDSVRVATTANITLSGTQTIDGIAVVAGDRVLVKNQSTASQNGIYVVAAGAWARSADADTATEIASSMVAVDEGTSNGGTTWDTDFKSTDTIGTTSMSWFRMLDTGYGQALTKTDDTNVTLTLGGTPATALIQPVSLTLGWSGQLSVGRGGTGASTLTGVLIGNGTNAVTAVAGTASQLLRRNAGNTAYEFFTGGNLTKTDDTNVTLTLGGTPTGSLINAVSLTLGWSGTLSVSRGGTGAATLTGVLIGNGTGAVTAVAGTASQLLRRNAGNTAYEFFTHDFASTAGATFTGQIITTLAWNGTFGNGQILLNGTTGNRIEFNANGVAFPSTTTRSVGTKILLYPQISASEVDYAIGIGSGTLWFSVPSSSNVFRWTAGTATRMQLDSGGLNIYASVGGTSLYLTDATNATLYITHPAAATTRFFNGSATQWLQEVGGNITIGSSTSAPSKLYVHNLNIGQVSHRIDTISSLTTLQTSIPLQLNDYYNSGTNGHQLYFNSTASTGVWEYNITKNWGGILTFGSSSNATTHKRDLYIYDSGQIRLANYTTTTSFAGTAAGYLAFDTSGNIITTAAPSGSSQWTTTGTHIYYTLGNVLIGRTSSSAAAYILEMEGSAPRVTLRATTNASNTGYRFDTKDSAGVQRVGGIYMVPDTGSLSYIGLAADDTNYQFVARANGYCGIGQTNPQAKLHITCGAGENGLRIDASNSFEILFGGNNIANIHHGDSGQTLFINTNAGPIYMGTSSASTDFAILTTSINLYTTQFVKNANLPAGTGGTLYFADDYTSPISARIFFGDGTGWSMPISRRNASTTTDLFTFKDSGQLQLNLYTTTSSFSGTAAGYLAFDSSGNVITTAAPSGSSQWTTNGSDIYYNTGNVGIGVTAPLSPLHILRASGTPTTIRWEQTGQRTYAMGLLGSNTALAIQDVTGSQTRWQLLSTGQFIFSAYTAYNSFSNTDAQGILGFDTSGNIISMYAPIYRHSFVADPVTANNVPANVSFFASSNAYVTEMDLTGKKRARLIARVTTAATAGTILRVRYAATFSTTASSYLLMGSTEIEVAISTTGILNSGWINLVAGAKIGVCYIALQTIGGDGSTDPVCAQVVFEAEE